MNTSTYGWWPYLYGAILFQGIFLGVVLSTTKRGNGQSNKYLGAIMFMFALATAERVAAVSGLYRIWPHLLFVSSPFWFMLPPLYYFYARSFTSEPVRFYGKQWLHAVPAILSVIYLIPTYAWPVETKFKFISDPKLFYDHAESCLHAVLYYGQSFVYLWLSILTLYRRAGHLLTNEWLILLYSILTVYVSFNGIQTVYYFFSYDYLLQFHLWGIPIYAVIIYSLAYFAFVKPEKIFIPPWKLWERKNGRLPAPEMENIMRRFEDVMIAEKLYLDCDLKYSDVAARLGISVRALSNALNVHAGQSFNDFVNSFRIQEAKYQIQDGKLETETVLSVALNSGFSTKSSFNRIFKNHTGLTPTEFLELTRPRKKSRIFSSEGSGSQLLSAPKK